MVPTPSVGSFYQTVAGADESKPISFLYISSKGRQRMCERSLAIVGEVHPCATEVIGGAASLLNQVFAGEEVVDTCRDVFFVAMAGGRVVAAANASLPDDGRVAYIYNIAVEADRRREGLGSRIVRMICARARLGGLSECHAYPDDDKLGNSPETFFSTLGFTLIVPTEEDDYLVGGRVMIDLTGQFGDGGQELTHCNVQDAAAP